MELSLPKMQSNESSIYLVFLRQAKWYKGSALRSYKSYNQYIILVSIFFFPFFKVEKGYIVYYKLTKYEVEANTSPPKNPNNPPKNGIHNAMNPVMAVIKFTIWISHQYIVIYKERKSLQSFYSFIFLVPKCKIIKNTIN